MLSRQSCALEDPCFSLKWVHLRTSSVLGHWLGTGHRIYGLSVSAVVNPQEQQLVSLDSYVPQSMRSDWSIFISTSTCKSK